MGRENFTLDGRTIQADRVRVQGTLTSDLWYDAEGRWVGCAFTAGPAHHLSLGVARVAPARA